MSWIFVYAARPRLVKRTMRARPWVGRVGPDEIAESFETPKKLIHGLLAHAGALGEQAGANPIRTRKLQYRHVRHAELLEPGRVAARLVVPAERRRRLRAQPTITKKRSTASPARQPDRRNTHRVGPGQAFRAPFTGRQPR
jgi:hypothetical protein